MSWGMVAEVLVLLAGGTFAMRWMSREPRPIVVKAPEPAVDPVKESLQQELETYTQSRDKLLREHTSLLERGYPSLARDAMNSVVVVNKRIELLRQELTNFPDKG